MAKKPLESAEYVGLIDEENEEEGDETKEVEVKVDKKDLKDVPIESAEEEGEEEDAGFDPDAEVTEEELRQYSKSVQKRINRLTSKHHNERREKEKVIEESTQITKHLVDENNKLKNLINRGEHVLVGEAKNRLSSELKSTQAAMTAALDAGDSEAITAAQSELARVMAQTERVNSYQPQALQPTQFREPPPPPPEPDEKAEAWRAKNKWFAKDSEMTAYAMGLHQKLVREDFIDPRSDQYYEEVDKNLRLRFPERFNTKRRTNKTVVSPAQRSSTGARSVTLSESQVRLAKRLGVTNEEYAAEVLKERQS